MQTLTPEEFKKKYGTGAIDAFHNPPTQQPQEQGVFSRVGNVINTAGRNVQEAISGEGQYAGQSPITRGFQAAGAAALSIPQAVAAAAPEPIRKAGEFVGEQAGKGFSVLTDEIASTKLFSDIGKLEAQGFINPQDNPEFYRLKEQLQVAKSTGDVASSVLSAQGTASTLQKGANLTSRVASSIKNPADEVLSSASNLRKDIQLSIAKKNVTPQLESSASRLVDGSKPTPGVAGTAKRLPDPVQSYEKYLTQSKKALTNIHADPAISEVGSNIGDAFTKVVKQRRAVGATIGDELKVIGKERVPVVPAKTKLLSEMKDSGLAYNPKTKRLTSFTGSKFAPQETKMLQDFVDGVNKLGDNPTVSQVDNFIAKTRTQLEFTKGASGVMKTTNAERIINGGMANLRESLNPKINGNIKLAKYWKANDSYSKLSDFVGEGEGYLGKLTQSGDFAKDASLAKSSVQSILNNGKKDWLIKLEGLTGYPALDNSVLALQAMKDAGDFRGLSLLQTLSEGAVPTSRAGFTQAAIDFAIKKGGEAVAGTAEEQTRAFLNALKAQSQQTLPPVK